jgi:segregation and condensation protein B
MLSLQKQVEALIFAAETGVSIDELIEILSQSADSNPPNGDEPAAAGNGSRRTIKSTDLEEILQKIGQDYNSEDSIMELKFINNAYQFLTKPKYHSTISLLHSHRAKRKLSQAALESLAIIAYKQPITKVEIEQIRGVNCDYTIQRLLEKELISIQGKSDSPGRPLLYGTSPQLLDYFGLNSLSELPKLKEITSTENVIGDGAE